MVGGNVSKSVMLADGTDDSDGDKVGMVDGTHILAKSHEHVHVQLLGDKLFCKLNLGAMKMAESLVSISLVIICALSALLPLFNGSLFPSVNSQIAPRTITTRSIVVNRQILFLSILHLMSKSVQIMLSADYGDDNLMPT